MKSHSYEFTAKDALMIAGLPLLPLGAFALAMHLGAMTKLLPPPRAALDADRTILFHQAEASRRPHAARVLLIGDSSCLMDVSAPHLSQKLGGQPALNLGTLSYLDLHAFATMLRQYVSANPNRLHAVVLLMHPEALRRPSASDDYIEALTRFYEEADHCGANVPPLLCALGAEIFRGRVLSRAVPLPLAGAYGRRYGFTHDLWNYVSAHRGSALDPGRFELAATPGNAEYRLAKSLEPASENFRAAVPQGIKLVVGITPIPESLAGPAYAPLQREMLRHWSRWLQADVTLDDLPAVLPDHLFASATHLNEDGVRPYTEQLGRVLASQLPKTP